MRRLGIWLHTGDFWILTILVKLEISSRDLEKNYEIFESRKLTILDHFQ